MDIPDAKAIIQKSESLAEGVQEAVYDAAVGDYASALSLANLQAYEFSQHYTVVLIDKLFVEDDRVSPHRFYDSVRKMHGKAMSLIIFVQEFFSDEFNSIDFTIK